MAVIIAHGGAGKPLKYSPEVKKAVDVAKGALLSGADALEAAVVGAEALESNPEFNAGTGSYASLDGRIEMDAALMTSDGRIGGVIAIRDVEHPIRVARLVMDTPHIMLASDGAIAFARKMGIPPYDPMTEKASKKLEKVRQRIKEGDLPPYAASWRDFSARYPLEEYGCDTIGVVVLDNNGNIAVANSTGGTSFKLPGRVGDSPQVGSGFWAQKDCGAVATGIGEEIARRLVSYRICRAYSDGMSIQEACESVISEFPSDIPVAAIAVDVHGNTGMASNVETAHAREVVP